jgi:acyl-CoA reductase-like NAD-dependent aldehyde dehydrogenase
MEPQFFNIINDELRGSEQTLQGTDPRTEEPLWPCPVASNQDFEDAITAAEKALPGWAKTTVAERQACLQKLADVITKHSEELIEILAKESGKSVSPAPGSHSARTMNLVTHKSRI